MTPETMRIRFWEARAAHEAAVASLAPLHEQRNALVAQIQTLEADLKPIEKEIKRAERPVKELQAEIATLSRALGGKVGPTPGTTVN